MSVSFSLYDRQSTFSKNEEAEKITSISKLLHPIDEVLGVDKAQFYEQVLQDPYVCFQPKSTTQ